MSRYLVSVDETSVFPTGTSVSLVIPVSQTLKIPCLSGEVCQSLLALKNRCAVPMRILSGNSSRKPKSGFSNGVLQVGEIFFPDFLIKLGFEQKPISNQVDSFCIEFRITAYSRKPRAERHFRK